MTVATEPRPLNEEELAAVEAMCLCADERAKAIWAEIVAKRAAEDARPKPQVKSIPVGDAPSWELMVRQFPSMATALADGWRHEGWEYVNNAGEIQDENSSSHGGFKRACVMVKEGKTNQLIVIPELKPWDFIRGLPNVAPLIVKGWKLVGVDSDFAGRRVALLERMPPPVADPGTKA